MKRREFLGALAALSTAPWAHALAAPATGLHVFGAPPAPERVRRVFAAGAPAAVLVHALAPDTLLGWPWPLADEALALLAPPARALPMLGRLAGRGSTLPLERLVALKPDLIVDAGTVDATYLSTAERVWRQTGIPYVLVDGRLADSARQLRAAGRLLGVAERGERLARYAETTLVACGGIAAQRRPRVYLARAADGLETPLPGSVNGECIEAACGINVVQGGGGSLARVSREQILAWSPEAIVTQYPEFHALALRDAFWKRLPAVREGRLLLAPAAPFGWLDGPPSVNRLIGVRWLAARLHGSAARTDWIEFARDFHALFYGHAPTREELARLPALA
ncbi:MAG: hypothetical protein ABS92_02295 [Thiobacillus sp. SCN 63-374]|nr:MAG: hypothetical protein ABS92_02295 [Thiobacillus sp. SCN 63-374]